MHQTPTPKWSQPRRHPGRLPGYRPATPYRYRDWAAL